MLHFGMKKPKIKVERLPIRISGYIDESIVDGPELRCVLFVQGCPHHCPGCHNPDTHSMEGGQLTTTEAVWNKVNANPMLKGITFSGGEPFLWGHELAVIGRAAIEKGMNVMTYSGYTYEQLLEMAARDRSVHELLTVTNYLIDGPFIEALKDMNALFRGSSNQRILDVTCYPNSKNASILEKL